MTDAQSRFDFDAGDPREVRDAEARRQAVDPTRNVALEASAGTGKTRVLVDRYIGLLIAGVKPRNILAITFTRKAAAEMRQRILQELARRHRDQAIPPELWREIRESLGEIAISTIDAFCLMLLREFPLEADVDPGFELADETETPRLVDEALDRTLRVGRGLATDEPEMALLFAELGEFRLRSGLARLLDRRLVTWDALSRFLRHAQHATIDESVSRLIARLRAALSSVTGGAGGFIATGPPHPDFLLTARDLQGLLADPPPSPAMTQALLERLRDHVLTQNGEPRKRLSYKKTEFRSPRDYERHLAAVSALGPYLVDALHAYRQDINLVLARAVRRLFAIALEQYQRTLRKYGVLDFSDVLQRTLGLLGRMDEFSRSRFKLESRYQHVLVDEFQDTSRAQWELVELLIRSWAAGRGLGSTALDPSIFIVGDRKQSIYGFRDAEVAVLDEAARYIEALRPIGQVRTAISRSFRAVAELLSFVNDVFTAIDKVAERPDAFRYGDEDVFPLGSADAFEPEALAVVSAASDEAQAAMVADEIATLLGSGATVRDRETGVRRAIRPGDIALLFRTRDGHQVFEQALAQRRVPYYVYKGLGFFDAGEIKDILALLTFLARPQSELNAAAFLRSGFVRLSDEALKLLAPGLAASVLGELPEACAHLSPYDRQRLLLARRDVPRWIGLVDRLPPSELLDRVLADAAYSADLGGPAYRQARENLKKVRALVRRIQNRGYTTLGRIVDHFNRLVAGGDESNAIVDALDAVNLMTTHAAKGLEFPVVFLVHLQRGSGGALDPVRVVPAPFGSAEHIEPSVAIGEHESDADRDLAAREAEEAKRLLYVALTRARDRVYLAATLGADGRFSPGAGGLGRTLPPTLHALLVTAGASAEAELAWQGASRTHRLRVIRKGADAVSLPLALADAASTVDDFQAMAATGVRRVAVTAQADAQPATSSADTPANLRDPDGHLGGGVLGAFVHRAIGRGGLALDDDVRAEALDALLTADERAAIDDVEAFLVDAAARLGRLRAHPSLADVFATSSAIDWIAHELPITLRTDGEVLRGTVDCVVARADGTIEVFEFKTGLAHPSHEAQLSLYVNGMRALFPGSVVTGRLIYAD